MTTSTPQRTEQNRTPNAVREHAATHDHLAAHYRAIALPALAAAVRRVSALRAADPARYTRITAQS